VLTVSLLPKNHMLFIVSSFSVLTFIKWRLTPSYAAKDTIFWQKRPKTIVIRIIVLDDNIQIYSYGLLCTQTRVR
jgi:hypothetical protein